MDRRPHLVAVLWVAPEDVLEKKQITLGDSVTVGPDDHPESVVTLAPDHPGAWTWLDARTLQFRPADPWPPLTRFAVRAGGASASLDTLVNPPSETIPAAGSTDSQSGFPFALSKARNFRSWLVAPMKSRPPAVTSGPP